MAETESAPSSELELQARFYSGELGVQWMSTDHREITLLDPGLWNREAGPDFIGATIQINGGPRIRGDIELDPEALDWERHGHAINPAFSHVVLHAVERLHSATYFTRTPEHRNVPQICLAVSGGTMRRPTISRETVTLSDAHRLLELAGQFRLHEKSRRLRRAVSLHGWPIALDQAFARALGYKRNSLPFLLLAQRFPYDARDLGEARLFGIAGFLQAERFEQVPTESRNYLRKLWDDWWKLREEGSRLILPNEAWSFSGIRPGNHPHRRIGALLAARRELPRWSEAFRTADPAKLQSILGDLQHSFWQSHWNLQGGALASPTALIGAERLQDFMVNVFHPWALTENSNHWETFTRERMRAIPPKIRNLAIWLCPELPVELLRFAWVQQGLLQLDQDVRGWKSPREFVETLPN